MNPILKTDYYKIHHIDQYPKGTEYVFSTWTPRSSRMQGVNKVVAFGFQLFVKRFLIDDFNENFFKKPKDVVIEEYRRIIKHTLGIEEPKVDHIEKLHDLGFLPIQIDALPEGTLVPIKVPMLTIESTRDEFFWLTNYLETLMSAELWQMSTNATIAFEYRKILESYAKETTGSSEGVEFQGHDFSYRGMSSHDSATKSSLAHLLSFNGTDAIPAILLAEEYYKANVESELVGSSIPATEHSVMCANGQNEKDTFLRLINEVYPKGFVSVVSDTWDFWNVVTNVLPEIKEDIMNRDGKLVIRPDSGDPVEILCGTYFEEIHKNKYVNSLEDAKAVMKEIVSDRVREETPHGEHGEMNPVGEFKYDGKYYRIVLDIEWNRYNKQYYFIENIEIESFKEFTPNAEQLGLIECLWNIFGGTVTEQGYKVLDPHIGAIYGDSITIERTKQICKRLKQKGFASTNVVLGIGSYTYQYNTRDTFGFALKATHTIINNEEKQIFKDPKTDNGMKKSQKGMVAVIEEDGELKMIDELSLNEKSNMQDAEEDKLQPIFIDGKLIEETSLSDIRQRLLSNL